MQNQSIFTWGIALVMVAGMAMPAMARPGDNNAGRILAPAPSLQITIKDNDRDHNDRDNDDTRVFQLWYGTQMQAYNSEDQETGERLADLVQMVTEVSRDRFMIADQQNLRRGVLVNGRTQIVQSVRDNNSGPFGSHRTPATSYPNTPLTSILHPGDLVIVGGYLRSNGGMVATRIRLMGRMRGFGYDNSNDDGRHYDGSRAWGTVSDIDARQGWCEIDINNGRRRVYLDRNGEVIVNGRSASFASLRRGDRLVFYYRENDNTRTVAAYRIVVMQANDRYPDGDRPWSADPNNRDGQTNGSVLLGRMKDVEGGAIFNRITLLTTSGELVIRCAKTLSVIDRNGERSSVLALRTGQRLRVTYEKVGDNLFAERIEIE